MTENHQARIGVLTSGGDAPGMNAAIRAIVRTALERHTIVFGIREGYQGLVDGGDQIAPMPWDSVGGILHRGGTILGTARCEAFRTPQGRKEAVRNLLLNEINHLIVIGGDGSLTGAQILFQEWDDHVKKLVKEKTIDAEVAQSCGKLKVIGIVGSIDNDFIGTDMTIGADTALHRITEAVDAISSTAASHQRTFVVKVMGRNCGYLALMSAMATGADWVLIPESPPDVENWKEFMANRLIAGRKAGRRDSIVILAEGARDRHGNPIGISEVAEFLENFMGEEVRVTVLGHVQRGGSPSAFDRNLGTLLGYFAVEQLLSMKSGDSPVLISLKGNRIQTMPLVECIQSTQEINNAINTQQFEQAMKLRGESFNESFNTLRTVLRALPHSRKIDEKQFRLAVMHSGAPAPGMNAAVRAAVRIGLDRGHAILGVRNGFNGLINGEIIPLEWMSVNGWVSRGGSELGTNRKVPSGGDFYAIARTLEEFAIDGLLIIGGWTAYESAFQLLKQRTNYPVFNIPIVCLPATIDNNLPGSELSIGADTALNNIIQAVDKIKDSAVAANRCFIVEVMGRYCGYLALMSGLSTGAERVYINEEGVTLDDLREDVQRLNNGFRLGKRLGLIIRNEKANEIYSTSFMKALFEEEGRELYDVRQAILGHLQQGGAPSPFDRILATRLAKLCIEFLIDQVSARQTKCAFIGLVGKEIKFHDLIDFDRMVDMGKQRPLEQWWMDVRPIAGLLAQPCPSWEKHKTKVKSGGKKL